MSKLDKVHAVHLRADMKPERQTLCGRDISVVLLKTADPAQVTCSRCRDSRRWSVFFVAGLNRKPT